MKNGKAYQGKQNNNSDIQHQPSTEQNAKKKKQDDKWHKVKPINLKGKKVDADPDKESDKPMDILNEPDK